MATIQCAYYLPAARVDTTAVWTPRCFNTAERLCDSVCYTRNQSLYIKPARLTPDIIGHLRRLGIGSNLPRKRTRRGGSRKRRKIAVLDCNNHRRPPSTTCKRQAHEHGTINFNNLITVPLLPSNQQNKCKSLIIAQYNPLSVGQAEKNTRQSMTLFWTTMLTFSVSLSPG